MKSNNTTNVLIALICGCLILISCKDQPANEEIPRIIFDTDMGSDCDDVGALALLNVYADRGEFHSELV